jgi:flagellar hook protein FlgE
MGLTNALYTGLTGLNANGQAISVIGNNISNSNTTGFKSSRVDFETQISTLLRAGTAPNGASGGTNPAQIGLGVGADAVSRDFSTGSITPTSRNTDLAIEGNGFFVVNNAGLTRYTRAGNFKLDQGFNLVNDGGAVVQGYGVDSDFNIVDNLVTGVRIPLGNLTLSVPTSAVRMGGNLNAGGTTATVGSLLQSNTLYSDAAATTPATATTALSSLYTAAGTPAFTNGDVITTSGITKGGASLPKHTFQVGAANTTASDDNGTTVQDFLDFLGDTMGIDKTNGGALTVSGGQINITGNSGTVNDLDIATGTIIVNAGTSASQPLSFTKARSADGESVRTQFVTYDSLGQAQTVDLSVVLESKANTGTTWRFYAQSDDDTDLSRLLGNGTLSFDTTGRFKSSTGETFNLDHTATGAVNPQSIKLNFDQPSGTFTALSDTSSRIAALSQDGASIGTLQDFSIDSDGVIVGTFSNSLQRDLGRVALATFVNPQGLEETGSNQYRTTSNSGLASVVKPQSGGAGRIIGGALEGSNVDLSREFINLINASTGYSANSRVLNTSDKLIQDLLQSIR